MRAIFFKNGSMMVQGEVVAKPAGPRQWWEVHTHSTIRRQADPTKMEVIHRVFYVKNFDYMEVIDDGKEDTTVQ